MPGSAGPIGDIIAISGEDRAVVEMDGPHGLENGALVRIRQGPIRLECYAKPDQSPNQFRVYKDQELRQTASIEAFVGGAKVESLNENDWAVVVGINYYPGLSSLRNLRGAVLDGMTFKKWVLDNVYVPDKHLLRAFSPDSPPASAAAAEPSVKSISGCLETLVREADKRKFHHLGRRLYLFFSGHGIVATRSEQVSFEEVMLLAADAEPLFLTKHVRVRYWAEWFRALGIFDEVFLFADCCRDIDDQVPPVAPTFPRDWKAQREEGRQFYVLSTKFGRKAYEQELGIPPRIRGVLSFVVTAALKNEKLYNGQKELMASVLEKHIYSEVPNFTDKQQPRVEYPHLLVDVVVAKWIDVKKQSVRIKFDPPCPGAIAELFAGNNLSVPLDSLLVDGAVWAQELDAHMLYKVAILGTDRKRLFETSATDEIQDVAV